VACGPILSYWRALYQFLYGVWTVSETFLSIREDIGFERLSCWVVISELWLIWTMWRLDEIWEQLGKVRPI